MSNNQITVTLTALDPLEEFPVREFTLTSTSRSIDIGRSSNNRVKSITAAKSNAWFNNPVMSRRHGILFTKPGSKSLYVRDLSSMHGTTLNGKIVHINKDYVVENNDVIKFGNHIVRGDDSFPARAYQIKYSYTPVVKHTSTYAVPEGDSSSEVNSMFDSSDDDEPHSKNSAGSEDDEPHSKNSAGSMSIRDLLAERRGEMRSRVANVVAKSAVQPRPVTISSSQIGNSQQNPVDLDEDDNNHAQYLGAVKEVVPDSVVDFESEEEVIAEIEAATASVEVLPESKPLNSDANRKDSDPEPATLPQGSNGNTQTAPKQSPPNVSESVQVQDYAFSPKHLSHIQAVEDYNEVGEASCSGKGNRAEADRSFGYGARNVTNTQMHDSACSVLSTAKGLRLDAPNKLPRRYLGELPDDNNKLHQSNEEAPHDNFRPSPYTLLAGYRAAHAKPKESSFFSSIPPAPIRSAQNNRPEPPLIGNERDRLNHQSVNFPESLLHEAVAFSPSREYIDFGVEEPFWSNNISSTYWDPVRGPEWNNWYAGENSNFNVNHSMTASRPLQGYAAEFPSSAVPDYHTAFGPTLKRQRNTEATPTDGFAPALYKAPEVVQVAQANVLPREAEQTSTGPDSCKDLNPRKQGMSILDILDGSSSKAVATAGHMKRKRSEDLAEAGSADKPADTAMTDAASGAKIGGDGQPLERSGASIMELWENASSTAAATPSEAPVRKRSRWQFAAGAATGAVVGGLGMLAALVSLPDSVFQ